MPYKHNESRRNKFTKPKYKVTNWPEYNDALRQRGDITIWFTEVDGVNQHGRSSDNHLGRFRGMNVVV